MREKCKGFLARIPRDMFIVAVLVLASSLSFGLGYLAGEDAGQGSNITIQPSPTPFVSTDPITTATTTASGQVVASKNGTKYYLPSCSGVERISEANKIWFLSAEAARTQGYTPAANCPGL